MMRKPNYLLLAVMVATIGVARGFLTFPPHLLYQKGALSIFRNLKLNPQDTQLVHKLQIEGTRGSDNIVLLKMNNGILKAVHKAADEDIRKYKDLFDLRQGDVLVKTGGKQSEDKVMYLTDDFKASFPLWYKKPYVNMKRRGGIHGADDFRLFTASEIQIPPLGFQSWRFSHGSFKSHKARRTLDISDGATTADPANILLLDRGYHGELRAQYKLVSSHVPQGFKDLLYVTAAPNGQLRVVFPSMLTFKQPYSKVMALAEEFKVENNKRYVDLEATYRDATKSADYFRLFKTRMVALQYSNEYSLLKMKQVVVAFPYFAPGHELVLHRNTRKIPKIEVEKINESNFVPIFCLQQYVDVYRPLAVSRDNSNPCDGTIVVYVSRTQSLSLNDDPNPAVAGMKTLDGSATYFKLHRSPGIPDSTISGQSAEGSPLNVHAERTHRRTNVNPNRPHGNGSGTGCSFADALIGQVPRRSTRRYNPSRADMLSKAFIDLDRQFCN